MERVEWFLRLWREWCGHYYQEGCRFTPYTPYLRNYLADSNVSFCYASGGHGNKVSTGDGKWDGTYTHAVHLFMSPEPPKLKVCIQTGV